MDSDSDNESFVSYEYSSSDYDPDDEDDFRSRRKKRTQLRKPKLSSGLQKMGVVSDDSSSEDTCSSVFDSDDHDDKDSNSASNNTDSDAKFDDRGVDTDSVASADSSSVSDGFSSVHNRVSDTDVDSDSNIDSNETPTDVELEGDDSDSDSEEVKQNKRKRKANACSYCGKLLVKVSPHLRRVHKHEPAVKQIVQGDLTLKQRRKEFAILIGEGNSKHNEDAIQSGRMDEIIPKYQFQNGDSFDSTNMAPCLHCGNLYRSRHLRRHQCVVDREESRKRGAVAKSKSRLFLLKNMKPCVRALMDTLSNDKISAIVKSEKTIIRFAESKMEGLELKSHESPATVKYHEQINVLRAKLRLVARFLDHFRAVTKNPSLTLRDALMPEKLENHLPKVVDRMSKNYSSPNSMEKLRTLLVKFFKMLRSEENTRIWERSELKFRVKWDNAIRPRVTSAIRNMREESTLSVPTPQMMCKFNEYINDNLNSLLKKEIVEYSQYLELAKFTLARITTFNMRRGNEVARMTVKQYERATTSQGEDNLSNLMMSELEKVVGKGCKSVTLKGKSAKNEIVYATLLPNCVKAIDKILEARKRLNCLSKNIEYVFATSGEKKFHLDGPRTIRSITKRAGVQPVDGFTAGKQRKYISTAMVWMESDREKNLLLQILGHTKSMHDAVYVENMRSAYTKHYKIPALLMAYEASISLKKHESDITQEEVVQYAKQKCFGEEGEISTNSDDAKNRKRRRIEGEKSKNSSKQPDYDDTKKKKKHDADSNDEPRTNPKKLFRIENFVIPSTSEVQFEGNKAKKPKKDDDAKKKKKHDTDLNDEPQTNPKKLRRIENFVIPSTSGVQFERNRAEKPKKSSEKTAAASITLARVWKHSKKDEPKHHSSSRPEKNEKKTILSSKATSGKKKGKAVFARWTEKMNEILSEEFHREFKYLTLPIKNDKLKRCSKRLRKECGKEISPGAIKGKIWFYRKDLKDKKKKFK